MEVAPGGSQPATKMNKPENSALVQPRLATAHAQGLLTRSIAYQDRDQVGLSDAWELAQAGNLTLLATSGDADGDGLSDQEEYLAGTDPRDVTSALRITAFAPAAVGVTITWTSHPSRQYQIYESATAAGNPWSLSLPGERLPGSPAAVTHASVTNAAGRRTAAGAMALATAKELGTP